jgi:tetratricopeptide (TPR) repeat protein
MRWLPLALALVACRAAGAGPYSPGEGSQRNTVLAQELNTRAADAIASDPEGAEKLLRQALGADLFFGPAHNNLGVLYLKAGKLYEAAGEFEWARKLMPGHPDPRMNLALTLEQAGKTDEAIQTYKTALEVYPGHIATIEALARLEVTSMRRTPELAARLNQIVLQGETDVWRNWARLELAGMQGQ